MDNMILITGHKNPDSDSICAAIAYAEYKRKKGQPAIPVRLGELNRETKFVLDYFSVEEPVYQNNVKTQVSDLDIDRITPVSPEISIKTAWSIMKKNNIKVLPVSDDAERLLGIITISDIARNYLDTMENDILTINDTPVGSIMTKDSLVFFDLEEYVEDIQGKMLQNRYRSYPVVDSDYKFVGFISRYHLISLHKKQVILLDHNEKSQTIDGIEQAEILEIIDHHRIGDIQTRNPVFFKNEPVGSTSTIIASIYFEEGIKPSKQMAGILCAAIISDTLNFKSPTCTRLDQVAAKTLSKIAEIDTNEFAVRMFKAGFALEGRMPKDILYHDYKDYHFAGHKIGIGQISTTDPENLNSYRDGLLQLMEETVEDKSYSLILLMITDIINEGSEVLFAGKNKWIVSKAFHQEVEDNAIFIAGLVSRKKQLVPDIVAVL